MIEIAESALEMNNLEPTQELQNFLRGLKGAETLNEVVEATTRLPLVEDVRYTSGRGTDTDLSILRIFPKNEATKDEVDLIGTVLQITLCGLVKDPVVGSVEHTLRKVLDEGDGSIDEKPKGDGRMISLRWNKGEEGIPEPIHRSGYPLNTKRIGEINPSNARNVK